MLHCVFLCLWAVCFQSSEVWFKETMKMHRQQKWQPTISSVVHDGWEPRLLPPLILCGWSFDKLSAGIYITNTLILLFEVQAYQLELDHAEEQTHFMRTVKIFFEMELGLMKSTALASVSKWMTYSSPAVSVAGWGKLSTKHLIPMSIRVSLLPKIVSFLWLYNLPASKYDY